MSGLEDRYRRLLRWYPASWRTAHGEVLLGTLLDAAEASERAEPTAGEAWSLRLNGIGERFDRRAATAVSIVAFALSGIAVFVSMTTVGSALAEIARIGVGVFLSPVLLSLALLCVMKQARVVGPRQTLLLAALTPVAWALAAAAAASWSVGFDEADANVSPSLLAAAFPSLFFAAWAVGAVAAAFLLRLLFASAPAPVAWSIAVVVGVFLPPVIGIAAITPMTVLLTSGGAVIAALGVHRRHSAGDRRAPIARPHPGFSAGARKRVAFVGIASLVLCIASLIVAATGEHWLPGADGTRAVRVGLACGAFAALPLLAAATWLIAERPHARRPVVWLGAVLIAIALGTDASIALASEGPGSGDVPWLRLLPAAIGLGLLVAGAMNVPPMSRIMIAGVVATAGVFPLWGVLVGAPVAAACGAIGLILWGLRPARSIHSPALTS